MPKTSYTSQRGKPVASLHMAADSSQCSVNYPTCGRIRITSRKDEQPQLLSNKADPCLSNSSISDKGETKRTICSVGEESSMMQKNLVKATHLFNDKAILPIEERSHHEHNSVSSFHVGEHSKEPLEMFEAKAGKFKEINETPLLNRTNDIQCNADASSGDEPPDEEGDISTDLVNAIKRIESRILALQLCSSLLHSKKSSAGDQSMHKITNSDSPVLQKTEGIAGNGIMNQQASRLTSKGKNLTSANAFDEPISTGNESLSKVANHIHRPETLMNPAKSNGIAIQGSSLKGEVDRATQLVSRRETLLSRNGAPPPAQSMAMVNRFQSLNRSVSGNDHLASQPSECIQGLRVSLNQDGHTRRPFLPAGLTNKSKPIRRNPVAQSETNRREKQPPNQMVLRPTLLDHRSGETKISPHFQRDRTVLENRGAHKMRASLPQHHESEEFSSSYGSSASWTSQQSSAVSSSDSEDTSPSSGRMVVANEDSSEESGDSDSYSHYDAGPPHRVGSFNSDRSRRRREPEKVIGRLRRLKNKLGLIFHHHHHHHHHHHYDDDTKITKVGHGHSMWNHLQTIFHGRNKHKVIAKGKVDKTRGIARVSQKKQVGHFHGLVEGLLRHVQHSKKRKPSKVVRDKGSRNPPRGNRKNLHWWQLLRRHRGVRLNNRGRLKVGFKSQKSLKN